MTARHSPVVALALAFLSCTEAPSSSPRANVDVEDSFEVVEGWAHAPSAGAFGRVLGVAVAPDGRVWVSHTADGESRNDAPIAGATLAVLDPATGVVVDESGRGQFRLPHALAFDDAGRLWVTDADANRITVVGPHGEKVLEIGAE